MHADIAGSLAMSDGCQIGVSEHEPFLSGAFKIDLHARMRAAAFVVDHDAIAEIGMVHALAELECRHFLTQRGMRTGIRSRTADLHARPNFAQQFGWNFSDKSRRSSVHLHAMHTP